MIALALLLGFGGCDSNGQTPPHQGATALGGLDLGGGGGDELLGGPGDPEPDPFEEQPWVITSFTDPRDSSVYDVIAGRAIVVFKNPPVLPQMDPNYFDVERSVNDPYYMTGYFNYQTPAIQAFLLAEALQEYARWPEIGCLGVLLPPGGTLQDAMVRWPVQYSAIVESVDADALISTCAWPSDGVPDDPQFNHQWNINEIAVQNSGLPYPEGNPYRINLQNAWRHGWTGGNTAVTAVLDTGVQYTGIYDLMYLSTPRGGETGDKSTATRMNSRWLAGGGQPPEAAKNYNSFTAEKIGHGTCVASIFAAGTNNFESSQHAIGSELAGISHSCLYFPVAMKYRASSASSAGYSASSIFNALQLIGVVKRVYNPSLLSHISAIPIYNIETVNCSFDTKTRFPSMYREVKNLHPYMLFVCSAGNEGQSNTCGYPALFAAAPDSFFGVLSVAAYDQSGERAVWGGASSNYYYIPGRSIAAPGKDLLAFDLPGYNVNDQRLGYTTDAIYTQMGGTSAAAPHVSGAASMLAARAPYLPPSWIGLALVSSGASAEPALNGDLADFPRLDIYEAFELFFQKEVFQVANYMKCLKNHWRVFVRLLLTILSVGFLIQACSSPASDTDPIGFGNIGERGILVMSDPENGTLAQSRKLFLYVQGSDLDLVDGRDLIKKVEIDPGDGSGWQDVTEFYFANMMGISPWTGDPTWWQWSYAVQGAYTADARAQYYDGEVVTASGS